MVHSSSYSSSNVTEGKKGIKGFFMRKKKKKIYYQSTPPSSKKAPSGVGQKERGKER